MLPFDPTETRPKSVLLTLRVLWGALLLGQLAFFAITMWLLSTGAMNGDPDLASLLFYVGLAMLLFLLPMAYLLRAIFFRRGRHPAGVQPPAYFTGTLMFLATLEGVGLFGIVTILVGGMIWPAVLIPAVAMGIQAINFPTGTAMAPVADDNADTSGV